MKAKHELTESECQLAAMNHHSIISTTDARGVITSVNDKFCEVSGYSRGELIGQNHRIIKSDHHSPSYYEKLWNTISQGEIWHGKTCNRNKRGENFWVETTIVPFTDSQGEPYKYISIRTDITALFKSEEHLNKSQDFSSTGIWNWNIKTDELIWSDNLWGLFGFTCSVKNFTYSDFLKTIHPGDKQHVIDAVNNCIENNKNYNIEHRVVWPDGSVHWVHEKGDVVRSETGEALYMQGFVQDISERAEAQQAHQESEEKYRLLFELSEDPMWLILGDRFIMANEAAVKALGYSSVQVLTDTHPSQVSPEHQSDGASSFDKANEMMAEGYRKGYHRFEWIHERKNGDVFPVDVSLTRVPYKGEYALFCVWRDITKAKTVEQALLSAKEEAEKANAAKSQFLSSMSHELRTPMNAIMGFTQLMNMEAEPPLNESQLENVAEIMKASTHLLKLIDEVLDLSKIENEGLELSAEGVLIGDVIADTLQLIAPLVKAHNLEITVRLFDDEISIDTLLQQQYVVWADKIRLKQALLNFLSNAIKYNVENGKIIIQCLPGEAQTRINVIDTGIGLTQKQQSQLFTPFERLGAEHTETEGAGIGLVITKKIIELLGGHVGVNSQKGKGSTFWIELLTDSLFSVPNNTEKAISGLSNASIATSLGEKERTVLYIEDNPANLRLVTQSLERLPNVHILSAHEPLLGLELSREHKPNLILLDINLPGINGFEVLKRLRQKASTCNTPVIAISANAMPADIEKGLAAGFDDYITKPIDIITLLQSVDSMLQRDA